MSALSITVNRLLNTSWTLTNFYPDNVARMTFNESPEVSVFVRADGTVSPPATNACHTAQRMLIDSGVSVQTSERAANPTTN